MDTVELIGRSAELEAFVALTSPASPGGLLVVEGEPGIGKSFLLRAFIEIGAAAGLDPVHVDGPLGDGRPLLVVDDVQWMDPNGLALLPAHLARVVAASGVGVVAHRTGSRTPAVEQFLERATSLGARRIRVSPMSDRDIDLLYERRFGRAPDETWRQLLRRAGGNPCYADLVMTSDADADEDRDEAPSDGPVAARRSMHELVLRRAHLLGDRNFALLRTAAVLGRSVEVDLLATVSGVALPIVVRAVSLAIDAELIDGDGTRVAFRHDLLREALSDDLTTDAREHLHRAALDELAARGAPAPEREAHLRCIDLTEDDVARVMSVAMVSRPDVGLDLVDAVTAVATAEQREELEILRVELMVLGGQLGAALRLADSALSGHPVPSHAARLHAARTHALHLLGAASLDTIDDLVLADPTSSMPAHGRRLATIGLVAAWERRHDLAQRAGLAALQCTDDPSVSAPAHLGLAWSSVHLGRVADAQTHVSRSIELLDQRHEPEVSFGPLLARAAMRTAVGESALAIDDVLLDGRAGDLDTASRAALRAAVHATALVDAGRWPEADVAIEAGRAAVAQHPSAVASRWLTSLRASIATCRDVAVADVEWPEIVPGVGAEWAVLAHSLRHELRDDASGQIELLLTWLDERSPLFDRPTVVLCGPELIRRLVHAHRTRAGDWRDAALDLLASDDPVAASTRAWLDGVANQQPDEMERSAIPLVSTRPFAAARMLHHAAEIWARGGDDARARSAGGEASRVYRGLGASALERQLREDLRVHGVRLRLSQRPAATEGWDSITSIERSILDLLAEGRTNAEIAAALFMSRRTVESHLVRVYRKLGIGSRVELVHALLTRAEVG